MEECREIAKYIIGHQIKWTLQKIRKYKLNLIHYIYTTEHTKNYILLPNMQNIYKVMIDGYIWILNSRPKINNNDGNDKYLQYRELLVGAEILCHFQTL